MGRQVVGFTLPMQAKPQARRKLREVTMTAPLLRYQQVLPNHPQESKAFRTRWLRSQVLPSAGWKPKSHPTKAPQSGVNITSIDSNSSATGQGRFLPSR